MNTPLPSEENPTKAQPRRDHRAALQAQKLRIQLATKAVRFGDGEPSVSPKSVKILYGSLGVGAVLTAGCIGAAKIIQMIM